MKGGNGGNGGTGTNGGDENGSPAPNINGANAHGQGTVAVFTAAVAVLADLAL